MKDPAKMSKNELRNEVYKLRYLMDVARHGVARLASPEAFDVSRPTNKEEQARMLYAEDLLAKLK